VNCHTYILGVILGERKTESVGVCGQGTGQMKTWAKGVYMGQEYAVDDIVCFYGSESRFAMPDDPGATIRKKS